MRIAIFGQAAFGKDVFERLRLAGHEVAGVHVPPDGGRPDPLAEAAAAQGIPLLRHKYFRKKGGVPIASRVEEVRAWDAALHVMPYTTTILPPEVVEMPEHGSLCFHPSLLPAYRGGAAIPWQLILDAKESGVTVFRPDAGVDTGPIVVQKGPVPLEDGDNAAKLYFDKLYPLGVEAVVEAVAAVADGSARFEPQDEAQASFQPLVNDEVARLDWSRPAREVFCRVRGCDPNPGAWSLHGETRVRFYDAHWLPAEAGDEPGTVVGPVDGRLVVAASGARLAFGKLRVGDAKKLPAAEAAAGLPAGVRLG